MLNAPRQLLQSGVRAVDTRTASGIKDNLPHPHRKTAHVSAHAWPKPPRRAKTRRFSHYFIGRRFAHVTSARRGLMDDNTSDARIEQDAQGVITDWNFAAERLFGWTLAEALGRQSHTIIPSRNRERHDRALEAILAGDRRVHSSRITVLHRDGREFTVDFATSLQDRDGEPRVVAFARETGATDEAAWTPAFGEVGYRTILDQIEDACAVVDLTGHYRYVNNAFCRLFGRARETLVGTSFRDNS